MQFRERLLAVGCSSIYSSRLFFDLFLDKFEITIVISKENIKPKIHLFKSTTVSTLSFINSICNSFSFLIFSISLFKSGIVKDFSGFSIIILFNVSIFFSKSWIRSSLGDEMEIVESFVLSLFSNSFIRFWSCIFWFSIFNFWESFFIKRVSRK